MLESQLFTARTGYAAGAFLTDGGGRRFAVHDPASGELLAELPSYGALETQRAIAAGEAALAHVPDIDTRAAWLKAVSQTLLEHRDELARIVTLENGKPLPEAKGEVDYAAGFYASASRAIEVLRPHTLAARPRGLSWTVHARPAGVVGLITPFNFPLAMLAKKLSAALAAGAPAVVKPAEKTPLSCIALFELLHRLGLPPGQVGLVFGDAAAIGKTMCEHPAVRVISFTGSTAVGKLLAAQAAPYVKRLALELGGNAPFIVMADADLDLAADQLMASKFRCAGQTCVCANRIYVQAPVADAFAERVATRMKALRVGPGLEPGVTIGPLIDQNAVAKVSGLVDDALKKGAQRVVSVPGPNTGNGSYFPPTLLDRVVPGMAILKQEAFGPLVPIARFEDRDEVIRMANDSEHGLAAYLFTGDPAFAERAIAQLHFGHVGLNTGTGPTPEAPFGGMKQSGLGREGGNEGILEMVELQTVPSP